eukprot:SAG22_NODE_8474_length_653_cov_0.969314_1_plen_106_part_10
MQQANSVARNYRQDFPNAADKEAEEKAAKQAAQQAKAKVKAQPKVSHKALPLPCVSTRILFKTAPSLPSVCLAQGLEEVEQQCWPGRRRRRRRRRGQPGGGGEPEA